MLSAVCRWAEKETAAASGKRCALEITLVDVNRFERAASREPDGDLRREY